MRGRTITFSPSLYLPRELVIALIESVWFGLSAHTCLQHQRLTSTTCLCGTPNDSLKWCSTVHIALALKRVIDFANPGKLPRTQEVRQVDATVAFLRTQSINEVLASGQWSSSFSFAERYLALHITDTLCIALGTTPQNIPVDRPSDKETVSFTLYTNFRKNKTVFHCSPVWMRQTCTKC